MGNSWDNKATNPQFTTGITTDSSTIGVFNTTATTVNAFGAATTLNLGSALTFTKSATTLSVLSPNSNTAISFVSNGTYTADTTGIGGGSQSFISSLPTFSPINSLNNASGIVIKPDVNAASTKTISYARAALFRMNVNPIGGGTGTITDARTVEISGPARGAGTVTNGYGLVVTNGSGCTNNNAAYIEGMQLAGDLNMSISGAGEYRRIQMGGGNSYGNIFTSFPGLGDGIHMGYNCYYNAAGTAVFPVNYTGSILSVQYASISLSVSTAASVAPTQVTSFASDVLQTLTANTTTWGGLRFNGTYTQDSGSGGGSGAQYGIYAVESFSPTASISNAAAGYFGPVVNAASTKTITAARSLFLQLGINGAAEGTGTVTTARTLEVSGPVKTNGTCSSGYAIVVTKGSGCTTNSCLYVDGPNIFDNTANSGITMSIGGSTPIRMGSVGSGSGTTAIITSNGDILKLTSSMRFKKNIVNSKIDSSLVFGLRPVEYDYKNTGQHDFGLIAEELEKLYPILINYDSDGKAESVKYDRISLLLLSELKKSNARIAKLEKQIKELKK